LCVVAHPSLLRFFGTSPATQSDSLGTFADFELGAELPGLLVAPMLLALVIFPTSSGVGKLFTLTMREPEPTRLAAF
jgi:hypothetical protein